MHPDTAMFDGIEKSIEDKFSSDQDKGNQPSTEAKSDSSQDSAPESKQSEAQALFDLSKADKFLLDGKEYTKDQLIKERLLMSDYTRKTQELAEQRRQFEETSKYDANLKSDLRKVLQDPSLVDRFKQIYPKEYHDIVDAYLERAQAGQPQTQGGSLDPNLIKKYVEPMVKPLQEKLDRYETEAATKQLDLKFQELSKKYPDAKDEFVLARLQTLAAQNVNITDEKIEEVFKYFDEDRKKDRESYHKEQLNKQKTANKDARDVASGGGIPGQSPKKLSMKNPKEIEQALEAHLRRSQV